MGKDTNFLRLFYLLFLTFDLFSHIFTDSISICHFKYSVDKDAIRTSPRSRHGVRMASFVIRQADVKNEVTSCTSLGDNVVEVSQRALYSRPILIRSNK